MAAEAGRPTAWAALGLSPALLRALRGLRYATPTPVQRAALPPALLGRDVAVMARTGAGKTAAFLLPLLHKLLAPQQGADAGGRRQVRALVLSPTRELAMQTLGVARRLARFCWGGEDGEAADAEARARIGLLVGGDALDAQFSLLATHPSVLIATPGRLWHLLQEVQADVLAGVQTLVFDEADRLFEMGFAAQLEGILERIPEHGRQTMLFSATMPSVLVQFARAGLKDPELIRLDTETKVSDTLRLAFFLVRSHEKEAALLYLLRTVLPRRGATLLFVATRHHAEFVHLLLQNEGIPTSVIYGSMDQDARNANLARFRRASNQGHHRSDGGTSGKNAKQRKHNKYAKETAATGGQAESAGHVLIVTDVAARGIDIPLLDNVINLHFPPAPKLFVHRVGRAARQGRVGTALCLVDPEELPYMMQLIHFLGKGSAVRDTRRTKDGAASASSAAAPLLSYTLEDMTEDHVHYGIFPEDVLAEEEAHVRDVLAREQTGMQPLLKVCENAWKQYRRSRPSAPGPAVEEAHEVQLELEAGSIAYHPLLVSHNPEFERGGQLYNRAQFTQMLRSFRPEVPIFEQQTAHTQRDKQKLRDDAMVDPRAQITMRVHKDDWKQFKRGADGQDNITRAAQRFLTSAQEEDAKDGAAKIGRGEIGEERNEDKDEDKDEDNEQEQEQEQVQEQEQEQPSEATAPVRRRKRQGKSRSRKNSTAAAWAEDGGVTQPRRRGQQRDFTDPDSFISYQNQTDLDTEAAYQPNTFESALLDVAPDESIAAAQNRSNTGYKWDARKRKFVRKSVEDLAAQRGSKRIRTESGVVVTSKASKANRGKLYEKWKKKSKREIRDFGDDDDRPLASSAGGAAMTASEAAAMRPGRISRFHTKGMVPEAAGSDHGAVRDELKTAADIRRDRERRQRLKEKNMSKGARRKLAAKRKTKRHNERQTASMVFRTGAPARSKMIIKNR